jgi:hypothetical protein
MIRWRPLVFWGAALAFAVGMAVWAGRAPTRSELPSVDNPDAPGLRALYLYLKESGAKVSSTRDPLTKLPDGGVLVIAAPTTREITKDEIGSLQRFVEGGGILVYLDPMAVGRQPRMDDWLSLELGRTLEGGKGLARLTEVPITFPVGAARGMHAITVVADQGLRAGPEAIPVASQGEGRTALFVEPIGKGAVWIAASSDLARNDLLEAGENLAFWSHLAEAGPILFDEGHLIPPPELSMPKGMRIFYWQGLAVFLLLIWAAGSRLGPPRPTPLVRHRASREYLEAFAWLTRRVQVEHELVQTLYAELRRKLHERFGISPELDDAEAARRIGLQTGRDADALKQTLAELRAAVLAERLGPRELKRLTIATARLERSWG